MAVMNTAENLRKLDTMSMNRARFTESTWDSKEFESPLLTKVSSVSENIKSSLSSLLAKKALASNLTKGLSGF